MHSEAKPSLRASAAGSGLRFSRVQQLCNGTYANTFTAFNTTSPVDTLCKSRAATAFPAYLTLPRRPQITGGHDLPSQTARGTADTASSVIGVAPRSAPRCHLGPPCPHPSGSQEDDLVICLAVVIVACAVWLPAACGAGPVVRLYEMNAQTQVPSSVPGVPMSDGIVV
ncbi:hypothetical protein PYCCODRAFT_1179482 [Trametes coccinea BRFM310]|uniref:Uncharacterized protein n=1 Tax=Trametes coccinea (strain BRFM310) TaxID=1353009 RepID=A0A1Y2J020_TRAC3|nr:hypothetical protein PYCCODRAFT_1179482 [Trametes coccinea BRFM310]